MKLNSLDVVIELTRWCNMSCSHCLRGERERKRNSKENIDLLLKNFEYINTLTFSGGEPALALDLIQYTLEDCSRLGIRVGNFWMATNGTVVSRKFFDLITDWIDFCSDNEVSGIRISLDRYHENIGYNLDRFKELQEELKYSTKDPIYFEYSGAPDYSNLINEGRAKQNYYTDRIPESTLELDGEYINGTIYLSSNGNYYSCCDLSYDTMRTKKYLIGNVKEPLEEVLIRYFTKHRDKILTPILGELA